MPISRLRLSRRCFLGPNDPLVFAKGWIACHKLRGIWTSKLPRSKKIRVFRALVESILMHGSNTWTQTKSMEKSLDGCYTSMLRDLLNIQGGSILQTKTFMESYQNYLKESERLV